MVDLFFLVFDLGGDKISLPQYLFFPPTFYVGASTIKSGESALTKKSCLGCLKAEAFCVGGVPC